MSRHLWTLCGAVTLVALALAAPVGARAGQAEGAWRMVRYEGGGNVGPATGQLTLVDGRFSLVYTMTGADGSLSGRAHAGGYTISGTSLALDVEWSMDHVQGKGGVSAKRSSRAPSIAVKGDTLTLTYENGAVMEFTRVKAR